MSIIELRQEVLKDINLDIDLINKAYEIAEKHHAGQKRKSGEDYIIHPVAVAETVLAIGGDTNMVCAALLHDVLEDTTDLAAAQDDIDENFDIEVFFIVEALTKDVFEEHSIANQERYLRKFRKKIKIYPQVFFIKVADLIHNLSTINALTEEKRSKWLEELSLGYMPIFTEEFHSMPFFYQQMYHKISKKLEGTLDYQTN